MKPRGSSHLRKMQTPDLWDEIKGRIEAPNEEWPASDRQSRFARFGTIVVALAISTVAFGFAALTLTRDGLTNAGQEPSPSDTISPTPSATTSPSDSPSPTESPTPSPTPTAEPGTVLDQIQVGTSTQAIESGFGLVWAASAESNTVIVIDPATNEVTGNIAVGEFPWDLAADTESVWVANADGTVSRIDPTSRSVIATITVGGRPTGITPYNGAVWVVTSTGNVSRIDPATDSVTTTIATGASDASRIAAGAGSIWVASWAEGTVTRVDQATGEVVGEPIVVPGRPDIGFAAGSLWATSSANGTLTRVEPSTGAVLETIPFAEGGPAPIQFSVGVEDDFVWVLGGFEYAMLQVDSATGEVISEYAVDSSAVDVAVEDGSLWLASLGDTVTEVQE